MKAEDKTMLKSKALGTVALIPVLITMLLLAMVIQAQAANPIRIVVVPYFTEEGTDVHDGGFKKDHYRRAMRYINNKLKQHGFDVVNPSAIEYQEEEYMRVGQMIREDSALASRSLCQKYGTDVAYVVWLKLKTKKVVDQGKTMYKGIAILEGEGYDSAGGDMGAGLAKEWRLTRDDYDSLLVKIEKEVGYQVGRVLTAWSGRSSGYSSSKTVVDNTSSGGGGSVSTQPSKEGGILVRNYKPEFVNVRLDGATQYEVAEVFGKIVNTATGVVEARRYSSKIVNDNPMMSSIRWRVNIENTEPFRLQNNIMKMITDVLNSGGELVMNGVPYRYTAAEVDLLRGIRLGNATSMEIQFVVDLDRVMDQDFSDKNNPYKPKDQGFN